MQPRKSVVSPRKTPREPKLWQTVKTTWVETPGAPTPPERSPTDRQGVSFDLLEEECSHNTEPGVDAEGERTKAPDGEELALGSLNQHFQHPTRRLLLLTISCSCIGGILLLASFPIQYFHKAGMSQAEGQTALQQRFHFPRMYDSHGRACKQQGLCTQWAKEEEGEELWKEEHKACQASVLHVEAQSSMTGSQDASGGALQALKEQVELEKEARRSAVEELEKEREAKQTWEEVAEQNAEARGELEEKMKALLQELEIEKERMLVLVEEERIRVREEEQDGSRRQCLRSGVEEAVLAEKEDAQRKEREDEKKRKEEEREEEDKVMRVKIEEEWGRVRKEREEFEQEREAKEKERTDVSEEKDREIWNLQTAMEKVRLLVCWLILGFFDVSSRRGWELLLMRSAPFSASRWRKRKTICEKS